MTVLWLLWLWLWHEFILGVTLTACAACACAASSHDKAVFLNSCGVTVLVKHICLLCGLLMLSWLMLRGAVKSRSHIQSITNSTTNAAIVWAITISTAAASSSTARQQQQLCSQPVIQTLHKNSCISKQCVSYSYALPIVQIQRKVSASTQVTT